MFYGLRKVDIFCKYLPIYVIIFMSEQNSERRWIAWAAFENFGDCSMAQKSHIQACFITKITQCNFNSDFNTCNFRLWSEMAQIYFVAMILFRIHVMGAHSVILFLDWSCHMSLSLSQLNVHDSMWLYDVFKAVSQVNWFVFQSFCCIDWLVSVQFIRSGVLGPDASF